ncbi:hypothetical protein BOTU111921_10555 [Bordetella tumbae]
MTALTTILMFLLAAFLVALVGDCLTQRHAANDPWNPT